MIRSRAPGQRTGVAERDELHPNRAERDAGRRFGAPVAAGKRGHADTLTADGLNRADVLAQVTGPVSVNTDTFGRGRSFNFGAQDNISAFGDRLNVVVGARRDRAHQTSLNRKTGKTTDDINQQTSSRAGALYKLISPLGVFVNWSETFTPLNGFDALGSSLRNQIGTIKEAGLKADALDGRFTATVSAFDLKLNNATRTVVINQNTPRVA